MTKMTTVQTIPWVYDVGNTFPITGPFGWEIHNPPVDLPHKVRIMRSFDVFYIVKTTIKLTVI